MRLGGRLSAAIEILSDIETRRRPAADALKDWGLSHRFAGAGDRAAIGNIVYDALRRRRSYAFRAGDESVAALSVAAVLDGCGLTPDALRARLDGDRFAPDLPSALLSAWSMRALHEAQDAVRADLPDWILPAFMAAFDGEAIAEGEALATRPPLDLRTNRLKADTQKVHAALEPLDPRPLPHAPDAVRIAPIEGEGRHPNVQIEVGFQKGWFEVQDAGSQLAAHLARAGPGMQVMDLCAGGGGKTLALASLMDNTGQIHATDSDRARLAPIHDRLKRAGVRNAQVHDPRESLEGLAGAMDIVLVDAPCTGTGTWRRRPDAKWRLTESALVKRKEEQDRVLDQAAPFVRPGGRLVYVTCSLLPAENAERASAFLARHPAFVARDAAAGWPSTGEQGKRADAEGDGADAGAQDGAPYRTVPIGGGQALQMTPLKTGTDGFFVAVMEKAG